jgi:hypothetical protein
MKNKTPVLEYCMARKNGRKARWVFKFRSPQGDTLIESRKAFASKMQAEKGFVSLMKSVATNQYTVEYPHHHKN